MMLGISRRKMYKKKFGKSQMSRRRKMCRDLEKRFGKSEMSRRRKIYRKLEEEVFRKSLMSRRRKMLEVRE